MTNEEHEMRVEPKTIESRFTRVMLTLIAAFFVFAGPTYIIYFLSSGLDINYFISIGTGVILLIVGLILIAYLIKRRVIV